MIRFRHMTMTVTMEDGTAHSVEVFAEPKVPFNNYTGFGLVNADALERRHTGRNSVKAPSTLCLSKLCSPPATQTGNMLRVLLLVSLPLCTIVDGCANGWPSTKHVQSAGAHVAKTCHVSGSRIVRSECSSVNPVGAETGEEYDRERQERHNGQPQKGTLNPAGN